MPNSPQNLTGVSSNTALQYLIRNDPYMNSNLSLAMSRGNLNGFDTNNPSGTGAVYNSGGIISINPALLNSADALINSSGQYIGKSNGDLSTLLTLDFTINHETWHADVSTYVSNYINSQEAAGDFTTGSPYYSTQTVNGKTITSFDATSMVNNVNAEQAQNENGAQLNGYNGVDALLSNLSSQGASLPNGTSPLNYNFGYDVDFGTAPTFNSGGELITGGSLNSGFNTSSISGLSGTFITFNVNPPISNSTQLVGANPNTVSNINLENSYYWGNNSTLLGSYDQADYASYNAASTLYQDSQRILPGAQLDYNFSSSGTNGGVTATSLLNDFASYGQNFFNKSGSLTINDTSSGATSGYTYYINWATSSSGSTTTAATLVTENPSGTPLSAEASGIGGVVSQTGVPVTIDQGSSASAVGNLGPITLQNGASVSTASASQTETITCGTTTATLSGAETASCAVSTLTAAGANLSGTLTSGTLDVTQSGDSVTMSNGTTADLSAGVTANLTCGSISGNVTGNPNGTAAVCTINGTTGTLTDATTGAAITVTGTGTAAVVGANDTVNAGSTTGDSISASGGGGNNITAGAGSNVTVSGTAGAADTVTTGNSTVNVGSNSSANVTGSGGNTVNGTTGDTITDSSAANTFTGSNYSVLLDANNLTATVDAGGGATVSDASGVTGGNVTFNNGSSWDSFYSNSGTATLGANADVNILGGATVSAAAGSAASLYGGTDTVAASNAYVNLNSNTQATITGGVDTIWSNGSGDYATLKGSGGDTITGTDGAFTLGANNLSLTVDAGGGTTISDASGVTGGAVTFNNGSSWDSFYSASGTATLDANADVNILGGATVTAAAGSVASLYGGTDAVTASNASLTLNANTTANLTGGGNTIYDNGSGVTASLLGSGSSGNTIDGSAGTFTLDASNLSLTDNASGSIIQDGSGYTGGTINVANNIGSFEALGSGITIDAGTGDDTGAIQVGGTTGTDIVNWAGSDSVGADSWSVNFNPSSSTTDTISDWGGLNATGSLDDQLTNWSASGGGGSQLDWYNPDADISSIVGNFSQSNENGNLTTEDLFATSGNEEKLTLDYNNSDQFTGYVDDYYNSSGTFLGDADYNSTGQETYQSGSVGDYGYYIGGYDLANVVSAKSSKGKSISQIAAYDLNHGQLGAASSAEDAFFQAQLTALAPTTAGVLAPTTTAAKWANGMITWSFGTGAGTAANPFSGSIGTQYQSLVENAFAAWASATGLKFQQVASSAPSDISIGFGDFDTTNSSVLGYTSSPTQGGQLTAGAVIRLEDPSQLALTTDANGQLSYSGTSAELEQVILHEIGHAIGLGDSASPTSVMYSVANSQDTTISASDIAAVASLYGVASNSAAAIGALSSAANTNTSASSSTAVSQFIQSMAAFNVSPIALTSGPVGQVNVSSTPLLAVSHAA
jgi:predicted Zn-dependent protease